MSESNKDGKTTEEKLEGRLGIETRYADSPMHLVDRKHFLMAAEIAYNICQFFDKNTSSFQVAYIRISWERRRLRDITGWDTEAKLVVRIRHLSMPLITLAMGWEEDGDKLNYVEEDRWGTPCRTPLAHKTPAAISRYCLAAITNELHKLISDQSRVLGRLTKQTLQLTTEFATMR